MLRHTRAVNFKEESQDNTVRMATEAVDQNSTTHAAVVEQLCYEACSSYDHGESADGAFRKGGTGKGGTTK
eukprot:614634-Prorocentrum_lima.AAC.1